GKPSLLSRRRHEPAGHAPAAGAVSQRRRPRGPAAHAGRPGVPHLVLPGRAGHAPVLPGRIAGRARRAGDQRPGLGPRERLLPGPPPPPGPGRHPFRPAAGPERGPAAAPAPAQVAPYITAGPRLPQGRMTMPAKTACLGLLLAALAAPTAAQDKSDKKG